MFKITHDSGFHITFDNGVTVSVQFGWGNYCSEYPNNKDMFDEKINLIQGWNDPLPLNGSPDAEIAIFYDKGDGEWLTKKFAKYLRKEYGDDVMGFVKPDVVLKALNWASKLKGNQ